MEIAAGLEKIIFAFVLFIMLGHEGMSKSCFEGPNSISLSEFFICTFEYS